MHPFEDLEVPSGAVGIHWFGQSSFALKDADGTIVQVDPYFPHDRPADRFVHARPPLHEASLRTDFILLTHDHGDHTCMESIDRIRAAYPRVRYVGPVESVGRLTAAGVPAATTTTVQEGDSAGLGSMTAHTVLAKPHDGVPDEGIEPPDCAHLGYVVEASGVRVYVSGDPINTFAEHQELLQPIRDLQPDIGFLTNHPTEGEFPFFEGSGKMAAALGLKAAVPAHRACFVARDYAAAEWATHLPAGGPAPLLIDYNQSVVYFSAP